ncbi:MAG: hypothetical protein GX573_27065 [Chloroflexi bacterium]|nr:hypothetical protein [Chloroflexota bacterium]
MSVLFLANVGNREIQVPARDDLPTKDARLLGRALLEQWDNVADTLEMPILGKAFEWVARKHGPLDRVVLFASDQADPQYRNSDTILLAEVIQRLVGEKPKWKPLVNFDGLSIARVEHNPADYDYMLRLYGTFMEELAREATYDHVYLAISGGTPAMASMLLFQGIRAFGERAQPLYITPHHAMPISLNIGQKLVVDALVEDLKISVTNYQYHTTLSLLRQHKSLLRETWSQLYPSIVAVVRYACERLNFNFVEAEATLFGADRNLPPELASRLHSLANDLQERDQAWLMREELFGAEIDFYHQAYKDAVANIFAFREELLRQLCIRYGMRLKQQDRKLDLDWLDTEPELSAYLKEKNIDVKRSVTTYVFERILDFRAKTEPELQDFLDLIEKFKQLADIRNQSTHLHNGVSKTTIREAYGEVSAILQDLWALYTRFTGKKPGSNPYDAINALILELVQAAP